MPISKAFKYHTAYQNTSDFHATSKDFAGRLDGQNTRMRTVSASPGGRNLLADSAWADVIS